MSAQQIKPLRGNIGKYQIQMENEHFKSRIFWARVVSSEQENLLTQYTKHTFFEVQYALEGKIVMKVDDTDVITVDESDFIIIPPDRYHQVIDADSVGARFIIAFSLEAMSPEFAGQIHDHMEPHLCHESAHMKTLLSVILQKNHEDSLFKRELITQLVHALLMEILSLYLPKDPTSDILSPGLDENERRVLEIQNHIQGKNGIGLDVADLARHFGLSERHLCRLFQKYAGESPARVIQRARQEYMENLIVTTTLSFQEISELCGYCDEYAMTKFFKKAHQLTPREYRRLASTSR